MKQKVYTLHICISFLNFLFLFLGKKYQIPKLLGPRNEKQWRDANEGEKRNALHDSGSGHPEQTYQISGESSYIIVFSST